MVATPVKTKTTGQYYATRIDLALDSLTKWPRN